MDQTPHMTKTEAHPFHQGNNIPTFDPNCPHCRAEELESLKRYGRGSPKARMPDVPHAGNMGGAQPYNQPEPCIDKGLNAELSRVVDRLHQLAERLLKARIDLEAKSSSIIGVRAVAEEGRCVSSGEPVSKATLPAMVNAMTLCESRYNELVAEIERVFG